MSRFGLYNCYTADHEDDIPHTDDPFTDDICHTLLDADQGMERFLDIILADANLTNHFGHALASVGGNGLERLVGVFLSDKSLKSRLGRALRVGTSFKGREGLPASSIVSRSSEMTTGTSQIDNSGEEVCQRLGSIRNVYSLSTNTDLSLPNSSESQSTSTAPMTPSLLKRALPSPSLYGDGETSFLTVVSDKLEHTARSTPAPSSDLTSNIAQAIRTGADHKVESKSDRLLETAVPDYPPDALVESSDRRKKSRKSSIKPESPKPVHASPSIQVPANLKMALLQARENELNEEVKESIELQKQGVRTCKVREWSVKERLHRPWNFIDQLLAESNASDMDRYLCLTGHGTLYETLRTSPYYSQTASFIAVMRYHAKKQHAVTLSPLMENPNFWEDCVRFRRELSTASLAKVSAGLSLLFIRNAKYFPNAAKWRAAINNGKQQAGPVSHLPEQPQTFFTQIGGVWTLYRLLFLKEWRLAAIVLLIMITGLRVRSVYLLTYRSLLGGESIRKLKQRANRKREVQRIHLSADQRVRKLVMLLLDISDEFLSTLSVEEQKESLMYRNCRSTKRDNDSVATFFERDSKFERRVLQSKLIEVDRSFGYHAWRRWFVTFDKFTTGEAQRSAGHANIQTTTNSYLAQEAAVHSMIQTFDKLVELMQQHYQLNLIHFSKSQRLEEFKQPYVLYEILMEPTDTQIGTVKTKNLASDDEDDDIDALDFADGDLDYDCENDVF